jgi:hypothetical protein
MKRTAIAAAWIIGTTVPLLLAAVFIFGCCVLPFHGVMHKAMPLCDVAVDFIRGEHHHHAGDPTPAPVREKQEPAKRVATELPRAFHLSLASSQRRVAPAAATAYRSFITLGAIRCDRDVGLHLLIATLLI